MHSPDPTADRSRDAPRPARRHRPTVLRVGALLGGAGLITAVTGTFLPWLVSGGVSRNSYAIVGIVHRLGFVENGVGATILSSWPLFPPVASMAFVAGILSWWRTAAVITALFGLPAALIGAGVLVVAGGRGSAGIGVAYSGPVASLAGGVSALAGATLVLIGSRSRRRGTAVGRVTGHPGVPPTYFSDGFPVSADGGPASFPVDEPRHTSGGRFEPMIQIRDQR